MEGDGQPDSSGNVVRLPRDWLGPREELVPIGPRARAAERTDDDPADAQPPTAASFWGEDSGSLQAPMQAPEEAWSGEWEPAAASRPGPPTVPATRRTIPLPHVRWSLGERLPPRRRVGAAIGCVAVGVLLVLAVIGQTEGSTQNAGTRAASLDSNSPIVTETGVNRARLKPHTSVSQVKTHHPAKPPSPRRATRHQRIRVTTVHRHRAHVAVQPTHTTSEPVHTTSEPIHTTTATTTSPAPVSSPSPTTTSPSGPAEPSNPPGHATSSPAPAKHPYGVGGLLSIGSSPSG